MNTKKKVLIGILSMCLVISITAGLTLSYFNDSAEKTNKFVVGNNVDIDIDEPSWPVDPPVITPGVTIIKDPTAIAVEGDSYMRMVVEIKDLGSGDRITDPARVNMILETIYNDTDYTYDAEKKIGNTPNIMPGTHYTADSIKSFKGMNITDFTPDDSRNTNVGLYYYNYKNNATNDIFKKTDPQNRVVLFTNVVIPSDWDKTQVDLLKNGTATSDGKYGFQIVVMAQAIQTDGFATSTDAFNALDKEIAKQP